MAAVSARLPRRLVSSDRFYCEAKCEILHNLRRMVADIADKYLNLVLIKEGIVSFEFANVSVKVLMS